LLAQTTAPTTATVEQSAAKAGSKQATAKDEAAPIQKVEIKGSATNYDPRRDDTASKTVLNREEIQKYGDDNIYDVLKRAPGVTVTGNAIRMRGLGTGYTQILVNGDRPPPGFSLDTLNPDQIERIEIIRAASAEFSMQAIAGTINIILRTVVAKPERVARVNAMHSSQNSSGSFGGTWADKVGNLSYFLTGTLYAGRNEYDSSNTDQIIAPSGVLQQSRDTRNSGGGAYRGAGLYPRLSWKLDNGNELNLTGAAQAGRSNWDSLWHVRNLAGTFPAPDWVDGLSSAPGSNSSVQGEANWKAKLAGGKLELTLSANRSRYSNDWVNHETTEDRALHLDRDWDTSTCASRYSVRSKFTRSLFDGHSLATGAEASVEQTDQTRDRHDQQTGLAPTHIVETFEPRIARVAAFAQDEWNIGKQLSVYLGARWEGVQTDSERSGASDVRSRNHVLSPVAQALYKFPGTSGRQLRLALTRTYKAPTTDQLTARRYDAPVNTRFTPDSGGNPNLRAELANGIDLAYEHFWAPGALFSVSASRRSITDYIRSSLGVDAQGRWLYQPYNDGTAQVASLESEFKMPLKLLSAAAAGFDARASVTRNWSRVATVPGPDNRLDAQVPLSATMGLDYKKGDIGFGASLAYQQGGWVRISDVQSLNQQTRRNLDVYALWKLDKHYQLRLTLSNLLRVDNASERLYADAAGLSRSASFQPGAARVGLNLEMKL
jgi:outer membrane receptor protein involved in Fe transport